MISPGRWQDDARVRSDRARTVADGGQRSPELVDERPGEGRRSGNTSLEFEVVGHPWDGCPDTIEPPLGPSFDDLVSYLEALPRTDISEIRDGTLDGYRAAYLEYRPADGHFDCFSGSPIPLEPGNNCAWIVDVDGVRLVIAARSDGAPSETVRAEVRQIVESIHIEH